MNSLRHLALSLTLVIAVATAASACETQSTSTRAAHGSCSAMTSTASAQQGPCAMHGDHRTAANSSGCPMHAMSAGNGCPMHAAAAVKAASCPVRGHGDHAVCATCADMARCEQELRSTSAHTQVVTLKNGAMVVYVASKPSAVRAVQATVARHHAAMLQAFTSEASLCADCRLLRGAYASGTLTREMKNTPNGCQVVMTSSDPTVVSRIHAMTGSEVAALVRE